MTFLALILFLLTPSSGAMTFDRTVQDWGDIVVTDGPQKCTFTVTNGTQSPQSISSVVPSCGCTAAKWTRTQISPGGTGTIELTYTNDQGAHPFDKTVAVYTTDRRKPTILHLCGVVHETRKPLAETYPVHFGPMALRSLSFKAGNMSQGEVRSGVILVANVGSAPIRAGFTGLPPQVTLSPSETVIEPGTTGSLTYTVRADRTLWGRNDYAMTPVVDGRVQKGTVTLRAVTKENFSLWTKEQRAAAPVLVVETAAFSFGPVRAGQKVEASFVITNDGRTPLHIYRTDFDSPAVTAAPGNVSELAPGGRAVLRYSLDTTGIRCDADRLFVIDLYTDSPSYAVCHLYISGEIL